MLWNDRNADLGSTGMDRSLLSRYRGSPSRAAKPKGNRDGRAFARNSTCEMTLVPPLFNAGLRAAAEGLNGWDERGERRSEFRQHSCMRNKPRRSTSHIWGNEEFQDRDCRQSPCRDRNGSPARFRHIASSCRRRKSCHSISIRIEDRRPGARDGIEHRGNCSCNESK
jgi:hypothetical protein